MKRTKWKQVLATLVVLAVAWGAERLGLIDLSQVAGPTGGSDSGPAGARAAIPRPAKADDGERRIADAFAAHQSGFMVEVAGSVRRTLPDDNDGSRHQRFILELSDGATVLVAHNIDLAPRVPLERGDDVVLKGQYEWSEEGGVLHWTHADPGGSHEPGWIRHDGTQY